MKTGKGLRIILWLLVLAVFAFSAYKVVSHLLERGADRRYQEDLIDEVVTVVTPAPEAEAAPAAEAEAAPEPVQADAEPDSMQPAAPADAGRQVPGSEAPASAPDANPQDESPMATPAPAQDAAPAASIAPASEEPAPTAAPGEPGSGTIVIRATAGPAATPAPTATLVPTETPPVRVDFDRLEEKYGDAVVAWIYCPETPINYVVVQGEDNLRFLRSLPDGSYSYSGSIFMDFNNHRDFSDWNTILYGHNMKNGSMFGYVPRFYNQEFFEKHPYMYVLTPERDFKLEIFAGYVTTPESDAYLIAQTQQELDDVVAYALEHSSIISDVEIREGDRIVTMSTCTYAFEDARYVLLGVVRDLAPHED